jgi:hypothetical protein
MAGVVLLVPITVGLAGNTPDTSDNWAEKVLLLANVPDVVNDTVTVPPVPAQMELGTIVPVVIVWAPLWVTALTKHK